MPAYFLLFFKLFSFNKIFYFFDKITIKKIASANSFFFNHKKENIFLKQELASMPAYFSL